MTAIQGKFSKLVGFTGLSKKKEPNDYSLDDRASYLLLKGAIVKSLSKQDEAIECFREVIDMQEHLLEKLYVPYCLYELGESYYIKGSLKEAEDCMKRCSKFSGYDWEDPLRVRLRVTMDQLKKGTHSAKQEIVSIDSLTSDSDANNNNNEPNSDDEYDDEEIKQKLCEDEDNDEDK